jgi:hypothetical protein
MKDRLKTDNSPGDLDLQLADDPRKWSTSSLITNGASARRKSSEGLLLSVWMRIRTGREHPFTRTLPCGRFAGLGVLRRFNIFNVLTSYDSCVSRHAVGNGLTVATAEMPHMVGVSVGLWVGVGSFMSRLD